MKKPDICVKVIRMAFVVDSTSTQKNVREQPGLNKNTLASLLGNITSHYSITDDLFIHRVVLDLGVISRQHLSVHFHQRLHSALVKLFMQLEGMARHAPSTLDESAPPAEEQADSALFARAIACLQPAALSSPAPPASEAAALYHALISVINARRAANPPSRLPPEEARPGAMAERVTLQHVALLALHYLLLESEGQRWLSQHSLTHTERDTLAAAIARREMPVEQLLHCIDRLEPLPVAQARVIAGRWMIPLWRYPGVRQAVAQQAGKGVMQQCERYLDSLLPGRHATPSPIAETATNIATLRPDPQTRHEVAERQTNQIRHKPAVGSKPQTAHPSGAQQREGLAGRLAHPPAAPLSAAGLPVANAGVILFWPLFTQWFTALGLMEEKCFLSDEARWQAVVAMDWLVWEQETPDAQRLVINQFLCGLPLGEPPAPLVALAEDLQQRTRAWVEVISQQLAAFEKMSLTDIRQLFLQRPGELFADLTPAVLHIEPQPFDVLLTKWPWPLNLAYFPWFDVPLIIEWPGSEPAGARL